MTTFFLQISLWFKRRFRRRWRRYVFLNRRLLSGSLSGETPYLTRRLPLPPGTYQFAYETWEVWGPPKIGETATEYWKYVQENGKKTKEHKRTVEVEPD